MTTTDLTKVTSVRSDGRPGEETRGYVRQYKIGREINRSIRFR